MLNICFQPLIVHSTRLNTKARIKVVRSTRAARRAMRPYHQKRRNRRCTFPDCGLCQGVECPECAKLEAGVVGQQWVEPGSSLPCSIGD